MRLFLCIAILLTTACAHKSEKKIETNSESKAVSNTEETKTENSNEQTTTFQKWEDTAPTITEEETIVKESATPTHPERTITKKKKITKAPRVGSEEKRIDGSVSTTMGVSATVIRSRKEQASENVKTSSNVGFKFRTWILLAALLAIVGFVIWKASKILR